MQLGIAASPTAGAVATASGLRGNFTAAATTGTHVTVLNTTNATVTAGDSASESLLGSQVLIPAVAEAVLQKSIDKVSEGPRGRKSSSSCLNLSQANNDQSGKTYCQPILLKFAFGNSLQDLPCQPNCNDQLLSAGLHCTCTMPTYHVALCIVRSNRNSMSSTLPKTDFHQCLETHSFWTHLLRCNTTA